MFHQNPINPNNAVNYESLIGGYILAKLGMDWIQFLRPETVLPP